MVIFGDVCGALRQKGVPGELFFTHFLNQSLRRWGWFRFLRCWMNPPPAKGKARRKPCTEKPSARFDEEREVGRPLFYSTCLSNPLHFLLNIALSDHIKYSHSPHIFPKSPHF